MSEPTAAKDEQQGSGPVPGDVTTEPVATAAESHVAGRVGPPSIAQDSAADWHTPEGVEQIDPGAEAPAETPMMVQKMGLSRPAILSSLFSLPVGLTTTGVFFEGFAFGGGAVSATRPSSTPPESSSRASRRPS